MTNIQLIEAQCRIEQVQTVLGFWLEGASPSNRDKLMIGAVIEPPRVSWRVFYL